MRPHKVKCVSRVFCQVCKRSPRLATFGARCFGLRASERDTPATLFNGLSMKWKYKSAGARRYLSANKVGTRSTPPLAFRTHLGDLNSACGAPTTTLAPGCSV